MCNMCNFVVRNILEVKIKGIVRSKFPYYSISSIEAREREREREREGESRGSTCFLCYPAISIPHSPETKKLKEKTEEAACFETAINLV